MSNELRLEVGHWGEDRAEHVGIVHKDSTKKRIPHSVKNDTLSLEVFFCVMYILFTVRITIIHPHSQSTKYS